MTKVIIASVTIMASVTYVKCDLWQNVTYGKFSYGKGIMASIIISKVLWQMKLSLYKAIYLGIFKLYLLHPWFTLSI